jgi:large subunit ribosomal protein L25
MEKITLKVNKRETGKKAVKDYRRSDRVVGVFYINGEDSIPILTDTLSLRPIVYTKDTRIIDLMIEGESSARECVLKEVTFDPISDKIKHFDLIGLAKDQKMNFEIPVVLSGTSIGVREGGQLQQNVHKLKIKCLASDLPENISIDISTLALGKTFYVHDLKYENIEFEAAGDTPIVSCSHSRASKSEGGAAAETEKKDKKG